MSKAWLGVCLGVCACSGRIVADGDDGADTGGSPTSSADDGVDDFGDEQPVPDSGEAEVGEVEGEVDEGEAEVDEGMQREEKEALLAVATFLAPATPLQWHLVSTLENGELVEVRLQSLSLDVGSTTTPRELVGESFVVETAVDDVGGLGIRVGELFVPGAANPITGSDITGMDVRMIGDTFMDGSACGTVTGMIVQPLETPLDGSTFAVTPIESLDALPDVVEAGC